jgi:hypothetical protein
VIKAILHLMNDQPLAVDLLEEPKPSDQSIVCTNVKTIDGKRPVFIDFSSSTFVFPVTMLRFLEMPREVAEADGTRPILVGAGDEDEADDLEIDEDFLRRVREA